MAVDLGRPGAMLTGRVQRAPRRDTARRGSWRMGVFASPAVLFMLAFAVYPLGVLLRMSLSDVPPGNVIGGWDWAGTANFGPVLASSQFWDAVLATGYFTAFLLVVNIAGGFVVASLISARVRSNAVVQGLMIFVWSMPPVVIGNVWRFLFAEDGPVNQALGLLGIPAVGWLSDPALSVWSVASVVAWASLPFSVVLMKSAMLGISPEILDAATVDGCGYWQARLRVVLPLLRPTMLILAIFTVMYAFRSFDFVYTLTKGGPGTSSSTLPFLAYTETFTRFDFGQGSAIAVLSMVVVFLLGFAYVRAARRELEL